MIAAILVIGIGLSGAIGLSWLAESGRMKSESTTVGGITYKREYYEEHEVVREMDQLKASQAEMQRRSEQQEFIVFVLLLLFKAAMEQGRSIQDIERVLRQIAGEPSPRK